MAPHSWVIIFWWVYCHLGLIRAWHSYGPGDKLPLWEGWDSTTLTSAIKHFLYWESSVHSSFITHPQWFYTDFTLLISSLVGLIGYINWQNYSLTMNQRLPCYKWQTNHGHAWPVWRKHYSLINFHWSLILSFLPFLLLTPYAYLLWTP